MARLTLPNRRGASTLKIVRIILCVTIGLLLLLIWGVIGARIFFDTKQHDKDMVKISQLELKRVANLVHQYELYQEPSALPDTLDQLVHPPEGQPDFAKPKDLLDVWGNPIRYERDGETFTLTSPGPDGQDGTEDDLSLKE